MRYTNDTLTLSAEEAEALRTIVMYHLNSRDPLTTTAHFLSDRLLAAVRANQPPTTDQNTTSN